MVIDLALGNGTQYEAALLPTELAFQSDTPHSSALYVAITGKGAHRFPLDEAALVCGPEYVRAKLGLSICDAVAVAYVLSRLRTMMVRPPDEAEIPDSVVADAFVVRHLVAWAQFDRVPPQIERILDAIA